MASVFRQTAVERLSSPDRLDSMLKITTPLSWLGIAAAAALAAAAVLWAVMGSLPTTVSASGFLVASYNTNTIYCGAAGTVDRVLVGPGDPIQAGDPVMEVGTAAGERVTVRADQTGTVSRLLAGAGTEVAPSSELLRISPWTENGLSVVCYVSPETAGRLREGMEAAITLSSGGCGRMAGRVTNIDRGAASVAAISELLGQDGRMAEALTGDGPLVAVTCELRADPVSACGYYFSGGNGPDRPLSGGERVSVQITVDECAPIAKVFPMLGR